MLFKRSVDFRAGLETKPLGVYYSTNPRGLEQKKKNKGELAFTLRRTKLQSQAPGSLKRPAANKRIGFEIDGQDSSRPEFFKGCMISQIE